MSNQQVILLSRPQDLPQAQHFALRDAAIPKCTPGGVLIKNRYASVDPAMRGWVSAEKNYLQPVAINGVMRSLAAGQVIESQHPAYPIGSYVTGWFGWQQYASVPATDIIRRVDEYQPDKPESLPLSTALGVLGLNGITAQLALNNIGRPQAGDTLLVSTAAGAVGSIVGQLGKLAGCRVLGLTGSDEKVTQCLNEFGYDAAINYKNDDNLDAAVAKLTSAPIGQKQGVDIFFDLTGGHISDAVWPHINLNGRVVQCGTAAISSWQPMPSGPRRERFFITQRLLQQGFVAFDHIDQWPATVSTLSDLIHCNQLHYREDIHQGLAQAPQLLENLYSGKNVGKTLIEIQH
jgi:NADPH-dependent curcumin reductase CurA